ncbi:MAG: hypothetical protein AAFV43_15845 [Planctomycetota bacterium]
MRPHGLTALLFAAVALQPPLCEAQTVELDLYASDGSRWFDFFSDAYGELGQFHMQTPFGGGDPEPSPPVQSESVPGTNEGYFQISSVFTSFDPSPPTMQQQFGAANIFVNDNDFSDSYSLTLNTPLNGTGIEVRQVVDFAADFNVDIADRDAFEAAYTTTVGDVMGMAVFYDGVPASLNFTAELELTYDFEAIGPPLSQFGVRTETGSIIFTGREFDMLVADPGFEPDDPAEQIDGDNDPDVDPVISANAPPPDFAWDVFGIVENVDLRGDYNVDGVIDGLDYDTWAAAYGSAVSVGSSADGNRDGVVDAADYTVWRDMQGALASIHAAAASSVPEPASCMFCLFGMLAALSNNARGGAKDR